jgi:hypothetical protein
MDWIEKQARFYTNLAKTPHCQAVVHLEGEDDETFWNYQLQSVCPGRYRFIYHSKSNSGKETTGCEQCLRFRPYLSKHFFICIDSDLRLLRGEKNLDVHQYIIQTYTYSWENHLCEGYHLQKCLEKYESINFDIENFLQKFSQIVYKPLLYLIGYSADSETNQLWNISKFNACIPLQPKRIDLRNNGSSYLLAMKLLFDKALLGLNSNMLQSIDSLTETNAYLHIQGHQLYKLILHIGTMLCSNAGVAFRTEVLDKNVCTEGYHEIEALQADLKILLGK